MKNDRSRELHTVVAYNLFQMATSKNYERGHVLTAKDALLETYPYAAKKKIKRLENNAWKTLKILRDEHPEYPWGVAYINDDPRQGTAGWRINSEETAGATDNINARFQLVHEPRIAAFRKALTDGGSNQLLLGCGNET